MYHELTETAKQRRVIKRMLAVVALLVLIVGVWFAFDKVSESLREQGELSMRNAILNGAKQCCAIEGAYPSSLAYLEENYGVTINRDNYTVTYEIFAENVMPSVVVISK